MMYQWIYNFTENDLKDWMTTQGFPAYRAKQVLDGIYRQRVTEFDKIPSLPKDLKQQLNQAFRVALPTPVDIAHDPPDHTTKFALDFSSAPQSPEVVECVQIGLSQQYTICLSSQVRCRLGCKLCASGQGKSGRDLTAGEMIVQVLCVTHHTNQREGSLSCNPDNIVFMGMGEPFLNYNEVMRAIKILTSPAGLGLSARRITVSTVGIVPEIYRFTNDGGQVNLAVSLHAPNNELRDELVPINRTYPIEDVIKAVKTYLHATNRRVSFEYVLIDGVNTNTRYAEQLGQLLDTVRPCHVNLIPYNTVPGLPYEPPPSKIVQRFARVLQNAHIPVTIRRNRGTNITAACGQLAGQITPSP